MARTALAPQAITRSGLAPAYTAANALGHSVNNTGREALHVKAGDTAVVVTLQTPGTVDGQAVADRTVSIPISGEKIIGPFPPSIYNQPGTEDVYVDFDQVTNITVAALRL